MSTEVRGYNEDEGYPELDGVWLLSKRTCLAKSQLDSAGTHRHL